MSTASNIAFFVTREHKHSLKNQRPRRRQDPLRGFALGLVIGLGVWALGLFVVLGMVG